MARLWFCRASGQETRVGQVHDVSSFFTIDRRCRALNYKKKSLGLDGLKLREDGGDGGGEEVAAPVARIAGAQRPVGSLTMHRCQTSGTHRGLCLPLPIDRFLVLGRRMRRCTSAWFTFSLLHTHKHTHTHLIDGRFATIPTFPSIIEHIPLHPLRTPACCPFADPCEFTVVHKVHAMSGQHRGYQ